MSAFATLGAFAAQLQRAEVVPLPDREEWAAMIARISVTSKIAVIDEETYWYFLEVLPPKYANGRLFAFAEGAEPLRLFWKKGLRYFVRPLTWDETTVFCRLARISLPN